MTDLHGRDGRERFDIVRYAIDVLVDPRGRPQGFDRWSDYIFFLQRETAKDSGGGDRHPERTEAVVRYWERQIAEIRAELENLRECARPFVDRYGNVFNPVTLEDCRRLRAALGMSDDARNTS